ncbi:v-type proton atpase subunit f [Anaeramoeba ignava]|uniref:V-type proton ATPase subunit F n=1 Tax=Anaeramoeba ignava TaxID=1746090 RepID=A0A9Q0RC04_ANAIG|nr:v-type proton atpase subunit f [Anaeramoeba ignava]
MAQKTFLPNEGQLAAVIGDRDTVTGFILAGVGDSGLKKNPNFLIVDNKTPQDVIENSFHNFLSRRDIAIIIINQHIAELIRHLIDAHEDPIPVIVEIPSKDRPYDFSKDYIMARLVSMKAIKRMD